MEGLMGAAKEAMGGGEAPPYDRRPRSVSYNPRRQRSNAEADKAGAAATATSWQSSSRRGDEQEDPGASWTSRTTASPPR